MKKRKTYENHRKQIWIPGEEYERLTGQELKDFHRTFCRAKWKSSLDTLAELLKENKTKQFFADVRRMARKGQGAMATFCRNDKEIKGTKESMKVFVDFYKGLFIHKRFPQKSNLWSARDEIAVSIGDHEIQEAIKAIPKGKAISTDGLPDDAVKDVPAVKKKVMKVIREILDGTRQIPKYWKTAKLVLLSKTGSKTALPH
jgi:hypothetical protein